MNQYLAFRIWLHRKWKV